MQEGVRELKERNNQRDRLLSWENKEWMTKIICYLREQKVESQRLEDIRQDITDMFLEAQDRGDSAAKVLGKDYKVFCDEILDSVADWEEERAYKRNFGIFIAWQPWQGMLISGFAAWLAMRKGTVWNLEAWMNTMWYVIFHVVLAFGVKIGTRKVLKIRMRYFFKGKKIWVPIIAVGFFLMMQVMFYFR